jgi:DNA-binding beta-propeller fold protein YncE
MISPLAFFNKRPPGVESFVASTRLARWYAIVLSIGLTFATGSTRLLGSSPPYPDEIQNPHIIPSEVQFGTFSAEAGELNEPAGIAVSEAGEIYIADTYNHRIEVFNRLGEPLRTWGEAGSAPWQFIAPRALAVSSKGEVFVADTGNNRIQVFDTVGKPLRQWGSFGDQKGEFKEPSGIAIDAGRVYVVDQGNERLQVFELNGSPLFEFGHYGDGPGEFNHPSDVTVDSDANLYVADSYNDRIQAFDRPGRPLRSWGGSGSHPFAGSQGVCG